MLPFRYIAVIALAALVVVVSGQEYDFEAQSRPAPPRIQPGYSGPAQPKPTPIAILKQINRHNEDGSYTYGYEGADGSFKIETKLPTGEVKGKYGYTDDTGKVRVVEYGATKYGFEPSGEGITVAPPTLVDDTTDKNGNAIQEYADERPIQRPQPRPQYFQAPIPQRHASPTPLRAQIPGAQPSGPSASFEFGSSPVNFVPSSRAYAQPTPAPIEEDDYEEPTARPKITYAQPRPAPQYNQFATQAITRPQLAFQPQQQLQHQPQHFAPQPQHFAPQPQPQPRPQYVPRPVQQSGSGRAGGVLDQLAKDYALPAGGAAPLHDISFGYY